MQRPLTSLPELPRNDAPPAPPPAASHRRALLAIAMIGSVIIVAVGVPMAVRGEITAGDFTAFILYLQRMIWYLIALGYVVGHGTGTGFHYVH